MGKAEFGWIICVLVFTLTSFHLALGLECYICDQVDNHKANTKRGCQKPSHLTCNTTCFEVQLFASDLDNEKSPTLSFIQKGCSSDEAASESCTKDKDDLQKWFDDEHEGYAGKVSSGMMCHCKNNLCNNKLAAGSFLPSTITVSGAVLLSFLTFHLFPYDEFLNS